MPADSINVLVRWLRLPVAILLIILWVPVTAHCDLESIAGLHFLSCCDHEQAAPHQDDDCETDACAVVESGFYKIEDDAAIVPESQFVGSLSIELPLGLRPLVPPVGVETFAIWSFTSRSTPPVRAPTLA